MNAKAEHGAGDSTGNARRATSSAPASTVNDDNRPIGVARVRCRAGIALRVHFETAFGELRKARQHAPVAVDRGGDAGVGRGEVHPAGLDGAQPRDLQVLGRRERIAEPGDVRDVHEDRRFARGAQSSPNASS
jgi:hypothetical protein